MSVTYRNPPLVELIAELRWRTGGLSDVAVQLDIDRMAVVRPKAEEVFDHFGALASSAGFGRLERLLPPNAIAGPTQVVRRYRPTDQALQAPLFQIGAGVLTANALPPYKSWADFKPSVRQALEWLFAAHEKAGVSPPRIDVALIRYLDAFRDDLTEGRSLAAFLREVMGVRIDIPAAISDRATDPSRIEPSLQLIVPTAVGRMEIKFGQATRGSERAVMVDMSVLIQREIGASMDVAIESLSEGRQVIHDAFRGLTAPLHERMGPIS